MTPRFSPPVVLGPAENSLPPQKMGGFFASFHPYPKPDPTGSKAGGVPEGTEELVWVTSVHGHDILYHSLHPIIMKVEDLSGLPSTASGFRQDTEFSQLHQSTGEAPGLELALHKRRQLWPLNQGMKPKTGDMPFTMRPVSSYVTWHYFQVSDPDMRSALLLLTPWWAPV